jgi:hypothetical protein
MAKKRAKAEDLGPYKDAMALNPTYLRAMGLFQSAWAGIEVCTDLAIGRMLGVTYEQTHLITSGLMFGRRARLFVDLAKRSSLPKKASVLQHFNVIRGDSLRDVFAHGYISSDKNSITFMERPGGGEFRAKLHEFSKREADPRRPWEARLEPPF